LSVRSANDNVDFDGSGQIRAEPEVVDRDAYLIRWPGRYKCEASASGHASVLGTKFGQIPLVDGKNFTKRHAETA
jgi:hypothetical protein